jgi:hypothetical protein
VNFQPEQLLRPELENNQLEGIASIKRSNQSWIDNLPCNSYPSTGLDNGDEDVLIAHRVPL